MRNASPEEFDLMMGLVDDLDTVMRKHNLDAGLSAGALGFMIGVIAAQVTDADATRGNALRCIDAGEQAMKEQSKFIN